jgi:hypothetical protein
MIQKKKFKVLNSFNQSPSLKGLILFAKKSYCWYGKNEPKVFYFISFYFHKNISENNKYSVETNPLKDVHVL